MAASVISPATDPPTTAAIGTAEGETVGVGLMTVAGSPVAY
jgi:hypothetical protein